ncbi:MAG: hypothetical protein R3Y67_06395 [Eubacteriales bacterium]
MSELIVYCKRIQPEKTTVLAHALQLGKRRLNIKSELRQGETISALTVYIILEKKYLDQWNQERIEQWIQGYIKRQYPTLDYTTLWYEPTFARAIGATIKEWPFTFLESIHNQLPATDRIYFIDGNYEGVVEFAKKIAQQCNHFILVIGKVPEEFWEQAEYQVRMDMWEEVGEELYDETGLMIRKVPTMPVIQSNIEKHYRNDYRPIVYDFAGKLQGEWRQIPRNAIYIDLVPSSRKSEVISVNRKDVTYCTYANFLDNSRENGYNILV